MGSRSTSASVRSPTATTPPTTEKKEDQGVAQLENGINTQTMVVVALNHIKMDNTLLHCRRRSFAPSNGDSGGGF